MNALEELKKRAHTTASLANCANQRPNQATDSHDSRDSQSVDTRTRSFAPPIDALKAERARLLGLAASEWIDAAPIHRLPDADLADCMGFDEEQRGAFVHMLADTASRHAGRVPLDNTAPMHCQHCGPVWTHPDIAAVLPVADGWPRALGCPWCAVRKAGGYIPRPPAVSGNSQQPNPDAIEDRAEGCEDGAQNHPPSSPPSEGIPPSSGEGVPTKRDGAIGDFGANGCTELEDIKV